MKILAGVEQPTSGHIFLEDKEIQLRNISEATAHGIGIIFQEMSLCPNLSVVENIYLAREVTQRGVVIDRKTQKEHTRELVRRLEQNIDPDTLVGDLRIGQQQIIEIARALAQDVRILIMDEPTSALSTAEVEVLFRVINELKSRGVSIIYISHKLDELLQIGDYVTVLARWPAWWKPPAPPTSRFPGSSKKWSARTRRRCFRAQTTRSAMS